MNRIVVGVDGSPPSLLALRWACREAQLRGDSLEVVTAWSIPAAAMEAVSQDVVEAMQKSAALAMEAGLAEARRLAPGTAVTGHVFEGQAALVLVDRARGADLLVLGARGLGEFRALLLGSVSQECSHHSPVPIVIVREET